MYVVMLVVLKELIEKLYVLIGWDLDLLVNIKVDNLFLIFDDVLI